MSWLSKFPRQRGASESCSSILPRSTPSARYCKPVTIDYRFADGKFERLPSLAEELVSLRPDVIFAYGGDVAPHAKKATSSIPIVVMVSNDPVQSGLVASLGRPGANI